MKDSVSANPSALESLLLLLSPEQQSDVLRSAQSDGVIYLNRLPLFDRPLSIRIMPSAMEKLRQLTKTELASSDDQGRLDWLKNELDFGTRIFPPPLDWMGSSEQSRGNLPVRIETRTLGIPCRLDVDRYSGKPYLAAVHVGLPEDNRTNDGEELNDELDDEFKDSRNPARQERRFVPNVKSLWHVSAAGDAPNMDAEALRCLVNRLAVDRDANSQHRETQRRCDDLRALISVREFAAQIPFNRIKVTADGAELEIDGDHARLEDMEGARVYAEMTGRDGKCVRELQWNCFLTRTGGSKGKHAFLCENANELPETGFVADSGEISQLQKQLDAVRAVLHPTAGLPQLRRLGTLLTGLHLRDASPVPWANPDFHVLDTKLTDRQREAVQKAIATPDVCLIQGPPGTGKTRVISEIVRQAILRDEKVLLVAPTHVAVDNVLERIGYRDEVSPVRCVHIDKLPDLPEHIQSLTFHRRREFVSSETARHSQIDLGQWRKRTEQFRSDHELVTQGLEIRKQATAIENKIVVLQTKYANVSADVQRRYVKNLDQATQIKLDAESKRDNSESDVNKRVQSVRKLHDHLTNLGQSVFTAKEHRQIGRSEAEAKKEHTPVVKEAKKAMSLADQLLSTADAQHSKLVGHLQATSLIVRQLEAGEAPPVVQSAIDSAVKIVQREQDAIVNSISSELARSQEEVNRTDSLIARRERQRERAIQRDSALQKAAHSGVVAKAMSIAWWGSFIRDYKRAANDAESEIQSLTERRHQAKKKQESVANKLKETELNRTQAIEHEKKAAYENAHHQYSTRLAALPAELEEKIQHLATLRSRASEAKLQHDNAIAGLDRATAVARESVHQQLLKSVRSDHQAETQTLKEAEQRLQQSELDLTNAGRQLVQLEQEVQDQIVNERAILQRQITTAETDLALKKEQFLAVMRRVDTVQTQPDFQSQSLRACIADLESRRADGEKRCEFLQQWTTYVTQRSEELGDRVVQYVNLVCATTMGIATDEFFGDKSDKPEKEFDMLVIDEAGKVTEPEFLVAATRARRWVLVGDHKQLPPYYDQILDPFIAEANRARQSLPLDADILRLSVFERLWQMHQVNDGERNKQDQNSMLRNDPAGGQDATQSRCVTLDVQRRMHPDLAQFISEMFYENAYYSPEEESFASSKTLPLKHFPHAVTFINIASAKGSDPNEFDLSKPDQRKQVQKQCNGGVPFQGYANVREAKQIIGVVESIVEDPVIRDELDELRDQDEQIPVIGVIAFYAGQVAAIRNLLSASKSLAANAIAADQWDCRGVRVSVNTVDAFQGKECSVILLSFTRSNYRKAIGFVDNANRLNVALSRARKKLILVGDAETLIRRARTVASDTEDRRSESLERRFFMRLVEYVEGRGKTMPIFQKRDGDT